MKNLLEIIPLEGLGFIKFGLHPHEVVNLMNESQIYEEWMGGNLNDSLLYHGLILSFDKCDSRTPLKDSNLTSIRIYNRENISLFGKSLSEWTEDKFLKYLKEREISYELFLNGGFNLAQLNLEIDFANNSFWVDFSSLSQENNSIFESCFLRLKNLLK